MVTLPLTGEPLALDLLNTDCPTPTGHFDFLADATSLHRWVERQRGRLNELDSHEVAALTDADTARITQLRKTAAEVIDPARTGQRPDERALRSLNTALRGAPGTDQLVWAQGGLTSHLRRKGSPGVRLATVLAEQVAALVTDESISRVKKCEAPACAMLFLPLNPRRRWCIPEICGNRARTARYYLRHKEKSD